MNGYSITVPSTLRRHCSDRETSSFGVAQGIPKLSRGEDAHGVDVAETDDGRIARDKCVGHARDRVGKYAAVGRIYSFQGPQLPGRGDLAILAKFQKHTLSMGAGDAKLFA